MISSQCWQWVIGSDARAASTETGKAELTGEAGICVGSCSRSSRSSVSGCVAHISRLGIAMVTTVFATVWWVQPASAILALVLRGGILLVLYPTLLLALRFFTPDELAKGRSVIARKLGRGKS